MSTRCPSILRTGFLFSLILILLLTLIPPNQVQATATLQATLTFRHPSWSGYNRTQGYHQGYALDFGTRYDPLVALADGTLSSVETNNPTDVSWCPATFAYPERILRITHANGSVSLYAHMSSYAKNPRTGKVWQVGDKIYAGETIGNSGESGCSYGPHLHFAVSSSLWSSIHSTNSDINPDNPRLWATYFPDDGYVDTAADLGKIQGTTTIRGWAKVQRKFNTATNLYETASDGAIDRVEIWLLDPNGANPNPRKIGNATYGQSRPDAGGNYGWSFDWNTTSVPNGTYLLQPRAVARNGMASVLQGGLNGSVKITVANDDLLTPEGGH